MLYIAEIHSELNKRISQIFNIINAELSLDVSFERRFVLLAASQKLLQLRSQIPSLIEESAAPAKATEAANVVIAEIEALRTAIRRHALRHLDPEHIAMIVSP